MLSEEKKTETKTERKHTHTTHGNSNKKAHTHPLDKRNEMEWNEMKEERAKKIDGIA